MKKKLISSALALSMLATMTIPAFAEEQTSPITVNISATVMNVTVPTQLPISVDENGNSVVASSATITNSSAAQVEITDIRVDAADDWTIKAWATDWSKSALGTKEFAFKINNTEVATDGSVATEFGVIDGNGGQLTFNYEGRIAPQDGTGTATLGNVVFTVGWVENKIQFTIDGTAYYAEPGMTWAEWANSEYNSDGYTVKEHGELLRPDGLGGCSIDAHSIINSGDSITTYIYP